ncbi:hypothetical protein G9A89_019263 [Geosiphon pyriformis]|nr:hypothetical protein G9A89_019263 [Geosiphon pyriformis]
MRQKTKKGLLTSAASVNRLIRDEIDAGISSNPIVIGGFSQGAALALKIGLTSEYRFAGIFWMRTEANKTTPIFMAHGDCDQVVPYELGHHTSKLLKNHEYSVSFKTYQGISHSSSIEEIKDLNDFLRQVLPLQQIIFLYVNIKLIGSSAGGLGSVSTGLEICSGVKSKRLANAHSHGASYKKPKKPAAVGSVVNMSAGSISLEDLGEAGAKPVVFWGSNVGNVASNVSGLSNVENITNLVAEETSYAESGEDDGMDKNTPRKTHTQMYMLDNPPNDDDDVLEFPLPIVDGANQVPHIRSCAPKKRNFKPVKSFTLDIEVSTGASTPSKFLGIIKSSFTSKKSLFKARELAISKKILVNDDLRKVNRHSDREVIVKEIPVDLPKSAVLVEFESSEVASLVASKWSVLMGKDLVHVALAVSDKQTWVSKDQHQALLYTLLVGTTAHDLSSLLESYGGKTCFIGHNPNSYVRDRCAIICFGDEVSKLAAIGTVLVFKSVSLRWAGLSLASCTHCKQFGHVTVNCSLGENSGVCGKKAQVAGGSPSRVVPFGLADAGLHSGLVTSSMTTDSPTVSHLNDQLAILECSLELLTDCISGILTLTSDVDSDMIVDTALVLSGTPPLVIHNAVIELSSSSSKVLTAKVGGLKTKLIVLEASVGSVLDKLNILCSGLGLSVPLSSQ